jgi:hypothetical protein
MLANSQSLLAQVLHRFIVSVFANNQSKLCAEGHVICHQGIDVIHMLCQILCIPLLAAQVLLKPANGPLISRVHLLTYTKFVSLRSSKPDIEFSEATFDFKDKKRG